MMISFAHTKHFHTALRTCAILGSPIAPFFMDRLYRDVNEGLGGSREGAEFSVHLADFPVVDQSVIDLELEKRMELARKLSSQVLSLRKRENDQGTSATKKNYGACS